MALGKRKPKQDELFIPTAKLATGPGHPFYAKLNEVLADAGFDEFVEELCVRYYKEGGQGDPLAQCLLGEAYYKGTGVPQDKTEAAKWYRKAADQGLPAATQELKKWAIKLVTF